MLTAVLLCVCCWTFGCATSKPVEDRKPKVDLNIWTELDGQRVRVFWSPWIMSPEMRREFYRPPVLVVSQKTGALTPSPAEENEMEAPGKTTIMILGEKPPTVLNLQPGEYQIFLDWKDPSTGKELTGNVVTVKVK
jgi:hypothetical protein